MASKLTGFSSTGGKPARMTTSEIVSRKYGNTMLGQPMPSTIGTVPSTWLCAIDSAHGGKNGLNLNGVKNQIGTIHFPDEVIICDELLKLQPLERLIESAGEILKITLISSAVGFNQFNKFKLEEQFILKNLMQVKLIYKNQIF